MAPDQLREVLLAPGQDPLDEIVVVDDRLSPGNRRATS
jgi:hypothetical protein